MLLFFCSISTNLLSVHIVNRRLLSYLLVFFVEYIFIRNRILLSA